MPPTKLISVDLGPKQASLQRHLESGHYENASQVLQDALDALDAADDEWLREKVAKSMANAKPCVPIDVAFERAREAIARTEKVVKRDA